MRQERYSNLARSVRGFLGAEARLKESENRYRSLEAAIGDAVVVHDPAGRILQVNSHFERTFGWTHDEALRLRIPFIPANERSTILRRAREILNSGVPSSVETKLQTKDGTVLEGIIWFSPLLDHAGKPSGLHAVLRDVTKERTLERMIVEHGKEGVREAPQRPEKSREVPPVVAAEEQQQKAEAAYQKLFQNHSEGIAIVDRNSTSAQVNPALARMLGYSPTRQFSPADWAARLPVQLRMRNSDMWKKALSESGLVNYRLEAARRDGLKAVFLINASVLERRRDGNHLLAWTFSDITDWESPVSDSPGAPVPSDKPCRKPDSGPRASATSTGKVDDATKVIVNRVTEQDEDLMERITQNYALTVLPLIEHLKSMDVPQSHLVLLETLDFNIRHMTSLFGVNLAKARQPLTPRELELCQLIRAGKDSREIAETLGLTYETVMVHRKHIRKKLGLKSEKQHLAAFLNKNLDRQAPN